MFYRYQDVWEAIYIYRKTFNSIAMFTRRFDKPDCDIVRVLIKELKEEFPLWYKNKLWRKKKSKTAYLRSRFIAEFTELFIMMVKLKSIAKNFLFS